VRDKFFILCADDNNINDVSLFFFVSSRSREALLAPEIVPSLVFFFFSFHFSSVSTTTKP
jgi:hypothetical protein